MSASNSFTAQFSEMGKAVLVTGLALLAATAVLLFSAEHELRRNNGEVQRANAALLQLADINTLITGVDLSARGYALTDNPMFIGREAEKQRDLRQGLARLRLLCDPEQADDIAILSRLVDRHAAIYAQFVKSGPGHAKELGAIITNLNDRQLRFEAEGAVSKLRGEVMADLVHHQLVAEKQQHYALLLTFGIVAIAFLGGLFEAIARTVVRRRKGLGGRVETART